MPSRAFRGSVADSLVGTLSLYDVSACPRRPVCNVGGREQRWFRTHGRARRHRALRIIDGDTTQFLWPLWHANAVSQSAVGRRGPRCSCVLSHRTRSPRRRPCVLRRPRVVGRGERRSASLWGAERHDTVGVTARVAPARRRGQMSAATIGAREGKSRRAEVDACQLWPGRTKSAVAPGS